MDVMLVLMAVLMIVAPTMTYQEQIKLPIGTKSLKHKNQKQLTIRIDKDKKVYIDKDIFTLESVGNKFAYKSKFYNKTDTVSIRADERLPYGDIMLLLRAIKSFGFQNVSLITE